jgi:hypothetical protein
MSLSSRLLIQDQSYISQNGFPEKVVAGNLSFNTEDSTDPFGLCVDASGTIYVSDPFKHIVVRVFPNGTTQLFAGTPGVAGNNSDSIVDGVDAYFNTPGGLAIDPSGNVYVADTGNNQIRRITPNKRVSLVAGDKYGAAGFRKGNALEQEEDDHALFNLPRDVVVDASNNIFISDTNNHAVRMIRYGVNTVQTVAGDGTAGDGLGFGDESRLNLPFGLGVKEGGDLIIADAGNYKLKRLDKSFNLLRYSGVGTRGFTLGKSDVSEYLDMFLMSINQSGVTYLIDYDESFGSRLLKINQEGDAFLVNSYPKASEFCGLGGVTVNNSDTVYVLETPYLDKLYSSSSSSSSEGYSSSSSSIDSSSSSSSSEGFSSSSSSIRYSSSSSSEGITSSSSSSSSDRYSTSSSTSSSSTSSSSSFGYTTSSSSSESSFGECEDVTVEVVGETGVVFVSAYFSEWELNGAVCLEVNGQEYQGTVTLLVDPAVYLTMNQPMAGIIATGDKVTICKGPCESSSSTDASESTEQYSESSISSQGFSSSSSLGECELSEILVIGLRELVFVSGHVSEWVEGEAVCLTPKVGTDEQGVIRLIAGKNVFITMDNDMTGIISNLDVIDVCKGPCISSSSFGYSSSSSSFDSSSSSSSSEGFSESSSSSEGFSESSSSSEGFSESSSSSS